MTTRSKLSKLEKKNSLSLSIYIYTGIYNYISLFFSLPCGLFKTTIRNGGFGGKKKAQPCPLSHDCHFGQIVRTIPGKKNGSAPAATTTTTTYAHTNNTSNFFVRLFLLFAVNSKPLSNWFSPCSRPEKKHINYILSHTTRA